MKKLVCWSALLLSLIAFSSACASEKTPNQPTVNITPIAIDNKSEWQSEWDKLIIDAKRERKITLYGAYGLASARDIFISTVKQKFGIEVEMTVGRPEELVTKLVTERRSGLYLADVYMGGATTVINTLNPQKMLDPIEPYLILPEIKDPNLWLGGKIPIMDKERTSFSSLAQVSTRTAINTSFVKPEEITSYDDLLNPKWKGKIIMSDPTVNGSGLSWAFLAEQLKGLDYIKELIKQEPFITRDSRLLSEWLARGKYVIGAGVDTGATQDFIRAGTPLWIVPTFKEGVELRGSAGVVGMINRPAHPNAAKVFLNWILSKDGQLILSKANRVASRRVDVPTDHLEQWQIPDIKINYFSRETEDAQQQEYQMSKLFQEIFAPLMK